MGRSGAVGDGSAGDEGKTFRHTTRNVSCSTFVLYPASRWTESMSRLGGLDFPEEFDDFSDSCPRPAPRYGKAHVA